MAVTADEWGVGTVVAGLYEIRAVLGRGGMGVVYRARHLGWGVDLAVKSPRAGADLAAFVAEAEAWVSLGLHPNVCACHYVRTIDGVPRLFAEHLGGGSLQDLIRSGALRRGPVGEAYARILDVAIQIAWGLGHAHGCGLIHQDVKPANVLLDASGAAKVTDFGLARALPPGASTVEVTGMTRAYASPEQAAGRPVGRASDVYSLAVSILEMLPGTLPPGLEELLRRCLDADPARRPQDMGQVAAALVTIWQAVTGRQYHRRNAQAADLKADELNNRGLSMIDLGRLWDASRSFADALAADPRHPAATYNSGLLQWRAGAATDEPLVAALEAIRAETGDDPEARELLGQVQLERGDLTSARACGVEPPAGLADAVLLGEERVPWLAPPRSNRDGPELAVAFSRDGRLALTGTSALTLWRGDRPLRTFEGHTRQIKAVALHPDGELGISAGRDATIQLWDLATGASRGTLAGHTRDVMTLALSPDGRLLASGGYDATVRLWSLEDLTCVGVFAHPGPVDSVDVTDGGDVATGSRDGFRLWRGGSVLHHWSPEGIYRAAVRFGGGGVYVVGATQSEITLWAADSGRLILTRRSAADLLEPSPDGRHLLTGGSGGTVRYWDLVGRRCLRTFRAGGQVAGVWLSPDGRFARSATVNGFSRLWRLPQRYAAPARLARPRSHATLAATSEAFDALLTGALGGSDLALLRQARALPGHERDVRALGAWQQLGAAYERTGLRAAWTTRTLTGHTALILAVALDTSCALTGSADGTARVWHGGGVHVLDGHHGKVETVALAPGIALTGGQDGTLRFWSTSTGGCLGVVEGFSRPVRAVAVSPDGRLALAGTAWRSLLLFDVATMQVVARLEGHTDGITSVVFSADGTRALTGGLDGTARLWSIPDGKPLQVLRGHVKEVTSVALGPGFAITAGHDTTVRRWDLDTGECTLTFDRSGGVVNSVRVTPDGRYALTAGVDSELRLWSVADGTLLHTLPGHSAGVQDVALLDGGWQAISGGFDKVGRLWYLDWELGDRIAVARGE